MSYDERLTQWFASMSAKYKEGIPDFEGEKEGRMRRRVALSNRLSTAIRTWGTEPVSNVTPRTSEKALARTNAVPESNVVPMRRGA